MRVGIDDAEPLSHRDPPGDRIIHCGPASAIDCLLTHLGALLHALVAAADREGFGGCTLDGECQAVCPKHIDLTVIARLNRDYLTSALARWWGRL